MKMKYTWLGQILTVLLSHLRLSVLVFIVWMLTISLTSKRIGGLIFTAFTVLFYIVAMYSEGYNAVKNDKKSYSRLNPIAWKGAVLPVGVIAVNIIVTVLYKIAWTLGSVDGALTNLRSIIFNVITIFWFSPFMNFMGLSKGEIVLWGYIAAFMLPIVCCFLGYYAGYKGFDITTKFRFLMYEKKKK